MFVTEPQTRTTAGDAAGGPVIPAWSSWAKVILRSVFPQHNERVANLTIRLPTARLGAPAKALQLSRGL